MAIPTLLPGLNSFLTNQGPTPFTPEVEGRLKQVEGKLFKSCELLPTDLEWAFVHQAFEQQKPTIFTIGKIFCTFRVEIGESFRNYHGRQQELAEAYPPKWPTLKPDSQRLKCLERWEQLAGPGSTVKKVFLLPLWHGTTKEGALAISQFTKLFLNWNNIGVDGVRALAATPLAKTQITTIDLSHNDIRVEGAKALAKALPQTQITTLDLNYNGIEEDEGALIGLKNRYQQKIDISCA